MKVTNSLRRACFKANLYLKHNSSTILTCVAAAGMVVTVVSVVKASPKAIDLLEEARKEENRPLTVPEKVIVTAPAYAPAMAFGASTLVCMFGANALNKKQQASLASACALASGSYKKYRGKLIELYGKETDENVRDAIVRESCDFHVIDSDIPEGKLIFYEELSGEYFERYERDVIDAEYHLNRNFTLRGVASLNEFYKFLGLPETEYGDKVGWSCTDGYCWIDFAHRNISKEDEPPVYMIDYGFTCPGAEYLTEWI